MKASEFITALQYLMEQHGDLEILVPLEDDGYWGVWGHKKATIVFNESPIDNIKLHRNYPPSFVVEEE